MMVTMNSIITARPSTMVPISKLTSPHWNQVHGHDRATPWPPRSARQPRPWWPRDRSLGGRRGVGSPRVGRASAGPRWRRRRRRLALPAMRAGRRAGDWPAPTVGTGWLTRWIQLTPRCTTGRSRADEQMPMPEVTLLGEALAEEQDQQERHRHEAGTSQTLVSMNGRITAPISPSSDRRRRGRCCGGCGRACSTMARPTPTSAAATAMTNRAKTWPVMVVAEGAEGHQVDVDGVEDQLDRHQHQHAVPAGQDAVDADAEQDGGEEEELVEQHVGS